MDQHQELCGRYLVSLLAAVLGKKQPEEKPEELSFEEIFQMAQAHQVSVMALAAVEQLAIQPEPALLAQWRNTRRMHSEINIAQILELNRLMKVFSSEGIRTVPLKGSVLKFMYPHTEYREMGDLDILIEEEDSEKARNVMEVLGYRTDHFNVNHHDHYSKGGYLVVELHRMLFVTESDSFPFFKDIWERVLPDEKSAGVYRLSHEDFYLFMNAHFEKHFHGRGSGIRSIMDFAIFLDAFGDSLDWAYIYRELTKLGLSDFHESVKQLAMAWFRGGPIGEDASQMERDLLDSGGVYGSRKKYLDNIAYHSQKEGRSEYILRRLFLSPRHLRAIYPALDRWPILYPVFLLHRLITKRNIGVEELRYMK